MKIYIVTYDLRKPGQNYSDLYQSIKSYDWCHCLDSTWLIHTSCTAEQVYKKLLSYIDKNDLLLIVEFGSDYQGYMSQEVWDWIKKKKNSFATIYNR